MVLFGCVECGETMCRSVRRGKDCIDKICCGDVKAAFRTVTPADWVQFPTTA